MSDYECYRPGKLILKGDRIKKRKKKSKQNKTDKKSEISPDTVEHNGWALCKSINEICGTVALEYGQHTYIKALDNGLFTLGGPHRIGEGPDPEEQLTAIIINDRKIALKSGYGKYLSVDKNGIVTGRSDAIAAMEHWEPVFQDGKTALLAATDKFASVDEEDDTFIALKDRVGPEQIVQIRSLDIQKIAENSKDKGPMEEQGSLEQIEVNYVKKFQKFQNKRLRVCPNDKTELKSAQKTGNLHETLLDRRSKMKADRYCK